MQKNRFFTLFFMCCLGFLSACTVTPPKNTQNICAIFKEKQDWYAEAKQASQKWGTPIHVTMAIMKQESSFIADAQPPRKWLLGFIPWFRASSAYGYAQAQDATWDDYLKHKDSLWSADRDEFVDACDFIGWYCAISHKKLGISKWNAEKLYLAYHEGHGGYQRRSFLKKAWLMKTAKKVKKQASKYHTQLNRCKDELESQSSFFW